MNRLPDTPGLSHPPDHFSAIAAQYKKGRFGYPAALFHFLSEACPGRDLAWDCATGSGQAAQDLTEHFNRVVATDISAALLALAVRHPKITYREAPADHSGIEGETVDLITVAQALHWFDLPRFWQETERVLKPGGILAFWGYVWPEVNDAVDGILLGLKEELAPCWPDGIRLLHEKYRTVQPPFVELPAPSFEATVIWKLDDYLAHFRSWSATRYHREKTGTDLIGRLESSFAKVWPGGSVQVRWPLFLRMFRKS